MSGTLFVVSTPIGNLEDITLRALRTLKEVDRIAAEDTRRTAKLLAHYAIRKPVVSLREHNEVRETPRLVARLQAGESLALVSDAGTPGIADPGTRLVAAAREVGLKVVPIPGPSAIIAALSASGQPADQFLFLGFPPAKGTIRAEWLDRLFKESRTVVFFEAPHRIRRTLAELTKLLVKRHIIVLRELTKIHEEFIIQPNITSLNELGEFTVVIGPSEALHPDERQVAKASLLFGRMTQFDAFDEATALDIASRVYGVPARLVRKINKKNRYMAKQQKITQA